MAVGRRVTQCGSWSTAPARAPRRAGERREPIVIETTDDSYLPSDKAMTELIAEMWEDIGINAVIEAIGFASRRRKNPTRAGGGPIRPRRPGSRTG
jgi:ABC-type transport system substrate-binding protein